MEHFIASANYVLAHITFLLLAILSAVRLLLGDLSSLLSPSSGRPVGSKKHNKRRRKGNRRD
jgi:hypothetical protein